MENRTQSGGNLPPPTTQYRANANLPPPSAEPPPKTLSGSLKHWLGGMVNNPTTGALSHDKVWANVAAGVMTYQFATATPAEWTWWAYGGMVGGYGLARRAIAAIQQSQDKKHSDKE